MLFIIWIGAGIKAVGDGVSGGIKAVGKGNFLLLKNQTLYFTNLKHIYGKA